MSKQVHKDYYVQRMKDVVKYEMICLKIYVDGKRNQCTSERINSEQKLNNVF